MCTGNPWTDPHDGLQCMVRVSSGRGARTLLLAMHIGGSRGGGTRCLLFAFGM